MTTDVEPEKYDATLCGNSEWMDLIDFIIVAFAFYSPRDQSQGM